MVIRDHSLIHGLRDFFHSTEIVPVKARNGSAVSLVNGTVTVKIPYFSDRNVKGLLHDFKSLHGIYFNITLKSNRIVKHNVKWNLLHNRLATLYY